MWDQVCWSGGNQAENSFIISRQYGEIENKYRLIRGKTENRGSVGAVGGWEGAGGDTANTFSYTFQYTNFSRTECSLAPGTKTKLFSRQYYLKAEGCSISEHPDIIAGPWNLREKFLCELRQCSFNAPKNCPFYFVSGHKTIGCHEN